MLVIARASTITPFSCSESEVHPGPPCQTCLWGRGSGVRGRRGEALRVPASAVTCPTHHCMMSICSRYSMSTPVPQLKKETPDRLVVCTVVKAVAHRLHLNVVAELRGVFPEGSVLQRYPGK